MQELNLTISRNTQPLIISDDARVTCKNCWLLPRIRVRVNSREIRKATRVRANINSCCRWSTNHRAKQPYIRQELRVMDWWRDFRWQRLVERWVGRGGDERLKLLSGKRLTKVQWLTMGHGKSESHNDQEGKYHLATSYQQFLQYVNLNLLLAQLNVSISIPIY